MVIYRLANKTVDITFMLAFFSLSSKWKCLRFWQRALQANASALQFLIIRQ